MLIDNGKINCHNTKEQIKLLWILSACIQLKIKSNSKILKLIYFTCEQIFQNFQKDQWEGITNP